MNVSYAMVYKYGVTKRFILYSGLVYTRAHGTVDSPRQYGQTATHGAIYKSVYIELLTWLFLINNLSWLEKLIIKKGRVFLILISK